MKESMKTDESDTRVEIKLAGFGGQGIALMGNILGKAGQIYSDKLAVWTQSYGPESRGGASSSDVVIDSKEIDYPYTEFGKVDIFVVMSKEAYDKFVKYLKPHGKFFYDTDMLQIDDKVTELTDDILSIPATSLAENLGNRLVANVIMLGFVTKHALKDIISAKEMKESVLNSVPAKHKNLNDKAFDVGYNYEQVIQEVTT